MQAVATLFRNSDSIPAEFIRPEKEQPAITTFDGPVPDIPTVDLSVADKEAVAGMVARVSREWGIFQVVNHGIPEELLQRLQSVGKHFFEMPQEEKEKYAKPPGSMQGYGTMLQKDVHGKKAWVDHLFHNIWPPSSINYQFWPKDPPSYRLLLTLLILALIIAYNSNALNYLYM